MELRSERVVLDTNVLIDLLRGREQAVSFIKGLRAEGAALATTSINIFELAWGAYRQNRLRDVADLAKSLPVMPLGADEAIKAGEEMAYLQSLGQAVELRDVLIGVVARENGYAVATNNVRDFRRIRGLSIIEYRRS